MSALLGGGGGGGLVVGTTTIAGGTSGNTLFDNGGVLGETSPTRIVLTADANYYVSTTGSNSNDGLTLLTAFKTLQFAWDHLRSILDLASFNLFIHVDTGSYAALSADGTFLGGATVEITGAGSANTTVAGIFFGTFSTSLLNPTITINAMTIGPSFTNSIGSTQWGYIPIFAASDLTVQGTGSGTSGIEVNGNGAHAAIDAFFTGSFFAAIDVRNFGSAFGSGNSVDGTTNCSGKATVYLNGGSLFTNSTNWGGTPHAGNWKFWCEGGSVIVGKSGDTAATGIPGDTVGLLQPGSVYSTLNPVIYASPAAGATVVLTPLQPNLSIQTGSLLATLTVQVPVNQEFFFNENQNLVMTIWSVNGVTALTVTSLDATVVNPPTTLLPGMAVSMIYDTGTNSWYPIGQLPSSPNGIKRVASDFSVTSSAVLANITGLTVNVIAGRTYHFEAWLDCTDAAAGGVQAAIAGTCTATDIRYSGYLIDGNTIVGHAEGTALGTAVASSTTTATSGLIIVVEGTITVNAAGTLTAQFAQNTSNVTASIVKRGSTFIVQDVT